MLAMKLLVAGRADVHARCGKYCSVLQMVAKSGNLEAVRWLVEMGVDVNVKGGQFGSVRTPAGRGELPGEEAWQV